MYLLSAWTHFHPAAENLNLMSNLGQKSNFAEKVKQAGVLCAVDLKEGEAPPANFLLTSAEGCGLL